MSLSSSVAPPAAPGPDQSGASGSRRDPSGGGPELTLVVRARRSLALDVVCFDLADPAGTPLPAWTAGAHVDVTVRPGLTRQYSLCGDPSDRGVWRIAVLREAAGRGGSTHLHDRVGAGTRLTVSHPRNAFALVDAPRYLLVAGGIGITPLMPMVAELAARGADWSLLYGGRALAAMAFAEELARYGPRVVLHPQDTHGLLPIGDVLGDLVGSGAHEGTAVYCCGPEGLLGAVEAACAAWPAGALHTERFRPAELAVRDGDHPFELRLARSGRVLTVRPGQSVLAALESAGAAVTSSCRDGTCGTCETAVLGGDVDHRDTVLSQAERAAGRTMMVCVSRSLGERLELDI
ncbi:PDR/VanB family oxidoreductase [Frankia sp. EUN1f]|uniref:PDR/VanB family oxidoreductase n=1 Tax=Parafrankia sp. EUN1f TaxID=102897 RepID=UPI0001C46834|nr:ferredoxin [Parafrankia sp. EUN1f]